MDSAPVILEPLDAYARWAPSYPPSAHNLLMALEERAMLDLLPDEVPGPVLDAACGSGRYARHLFQRGCRRIVGLDLSPAMLRAAVASGTVAAFARGRLEALPFASASFGAVICGLAIGDVSDLHSALAEAARVLRPGGVLLYSDLHPDGARTGRQRTFADADGRWAVRHHVHDLADHRAAGRAASLRIDAVSEPRIPPPHPDAGRRAALVLRARRSPGG